MAIDLAEISGDIIRLVQLNDSELLPLDALHSLASQNLKERKDIPAFEKAILQRISTAKRIEENLALIYSTVRQLRYSERFLLSARYLFSAKGNTQQIILSLQKLEVLLKAGQCDENFITKNINETKYKYKKNHLLILDTAATIETVNKIESIMEGFESHTLSEADLQTGDILVTLRSEMLVKELKKGERAVWAGADKNNRLTGYAKGLYFQLMSILTSTRLAHVLMFFRREDGSPALLDTRVEAKVLYEARAAQGDNSPIQNHVKLRAWEINPGEIYFIMRLKQDIPDHDGIISRLRINILSEAEARKPFSHNKNLGFVTTSFMRAGAQLFTKGASEIRNKGIAWFKKESKDELVCSELANDIYLNAGVELTPKSVHGGSVTPLDLLHSPKLVMAGILIDPGLGHELTKEYLKDLNSQIYGGRYKFN